MFFAGSRGQKLAYDLDIRTPNSRDIAVVIHGMLCSRKTATVVHVAEAMKVNTLRFDFSGNGESDGEFTLAGYEREAEEVKDAVEFCRREGYRVVAIVGHSKGAQVVLIYSAIYGDVPIIVSLAPRFDMKVLNGLLVPHLEAIERDGFAMVTYHKKEFRITTEMVQERAGVDMAGYARRARNWVMLIHCEEDEVIPVADAHLFKAAMGDRLLKLVVLPGGSHFFQGDTLLAATEAINEFFSQMLPIYSLRGTV